MSNIETVLGHCENAIRAATKKWWRLLMPRIFISFIFLSTMLFASDEGMVKGRVKDTQGAAIPDAYVLVHLSGPGTAADVRVALKRDGSFSVALKPGFYDIFVTRAGFAPVCKKVEVRTGLTTTFNARIGMSKTESAN